MRTETREVTETRTLYICETCGREYQHDFGAQHCEKLHSQPTYKHSWEYTLFTGDERAEIHRACERCMKTESRDFYNAPSKALEATWAVIGEE